MIRQSHILLQSQIYKLLSKETLTEKKGFTFHPLYALRFIPDILELSQRLRLSYWFSRALGKEDVERRKSESGESGERTPRWRFNMRCMSISDAPASHAAWRRNEILHYFLDQYFCFPVPVPNTKTIKYICSYSIGSFILANVLCSKQQANRVFK